MLQISSKILSLASNIVLQTSKLNVIRAGLKVGRKCQKGGIVIPKTKYPLNQIDANSYIAKLKAKGTPSIYEPDVVRTFNVVICDRGNKKKKIVPKIKRSVSFSNKDDIAKPNLSTASNRGYHQDQSSKANFKYGYCNHGRKFHKRRVSFFNKDDIAKSNISTASNRCYHQNKSSKATFKYGYCIHGRKFHTGCQRCVTFRFEKNLKRNKQFRDDEILMQPRIIRPHTLYRNWLAYERKLNLKPPSTEPIPKFEFIPIPSRFCENITYTAEIHEKQMEEAAIQEEIDLFEQNQAKIRKMILTKDRILTTRPPICHDKCGTEKQKKSDRCPLRIEVPLDLLDKKPIRKKGKKKKGKHSKFQSYGIEDEEMTAMLMDSSNDGRSSTYSRPEFQ